MLDAPAYKFAPHMSAFTLAYGRLKINEVMDSVGRDRIIAVQTDGVLVDMTKEGPAAVATPGLGGLKIEARGRCEYVHVNKHRMLAADGTVMNKAGTNKPASCGRW
jgi:hypothetical protein